MNEEIGKGVKWAEVEPYLGKVNSLPILIVEEGEMTWAEPKTLLCRGISLIEGKLTLHMTRVEPGIVVVNDTTLEETKYSVYHEIDFTEIMEKIQ